MKSHKILIVVAVVLGVLVVVVDVSMSKGQLAMAMVRDATQGFQSVAVAEAAGYVNVNVDECVASPKGTMGYHFVNFDLVDLKLDQQHPEVLVFVPGPNGELRLGAVLYAVPIEPWDAITESPPEILGQALKPNTVSGLYVLYAWLYEENPLGIFADWNPNLSCAVYQKTLKV